MLNWLFKLIPATWTWTIAAKKASYMAGKAVVAIMAYKKMNLLSAHLTPDQMTQIQVLSGALVAAGLETLHDALKLHYPDASWL